MSLHDSHERIQQLLYSSALGESRWSDAANLIAEVTQTKGTALGFGTGRHQREAELFFTRICLRGKYRRDLEQDYYRRYYLNDESLPRLARVPHGQLVLTGDLYTDQEKRTSMAYNEARRRMEMQNGLNVRLDGPVGSHIVLSVSDSAAPGGHWTSDQITTITGIMPHVSQFVRVRQMLADAGALGRSLVGLLDNSRLGIVHLDRDGRIVEANDRAQDLLRARDGLGDSGGFLRVQERAGNDALQRVLARALRPLGYPAFGGSVMVKRTTATSQLVVQVTPVPAIERHITARSTAALVIIVDPEAPATIDPALVGKALGLTPAESNVAVMLATGHSPQDIATLTGSSVGTVRWHLKRIFRKQHVSRQADLVRRILALESIPGPEG